MKQDAAYWEAIRAEGRLLRPKEVAKRLGLSRSQIYSLIAQGVLPPFVKIGGRASGMPESWLDAFIQDRVQQRAVTDTLVAKEQYYG